MKKTIQSLKQVNWKLFLALLVMGLCPTIYTTVRTFFLGQLPDGWAYSIAGQLSWVNLLYEVVNEAIILPLFFFLGKVADDPKEFANRLETGLIVSFVIYGIMASLLNWFAEPLLKWMAASPEIIEASAEYIRIESIANVLGVMVSFLTVALVALGKDKLVYLLTEVRLVLCLVYDTFAVSSLPFSLQLGVNGIGISNIIVNGTLFVVLLLILRRLGYKVFMRRKTSFRWMKDFVKIGGISGLESFVRNIAYIVMVSRLVNVVGEQGTYWVANNFIWGWLLLPVLQLGELIKQETATNENAVKDHTRGYFAITGTICILWFLLIPLYQPFMRYVLNYNDVEKLFGLVMILLGFYVAFAVQNVFDMTFYGRGKTAYMLAESVITNTIYYGTFFILYLTGVFVPTLTGIALMFGFGNLFDSIVSGIAYAVFLKREGIKVRTTTTVI